MFNYCPPKVLKNLESETGVNGKRFYILPSGVRVPSITTVLGAMKREAIQAWRQRVGEDVANQISRKATGRGTNVHTLCERYLNNDSLGDVMPDAKEMFQSIKPYLNKINNIHYQEQSLWSKNLGIAGRVDCIAEYEGVLSIIDFKTSRKVKTLEQIEDYFWQTCAYALMYEERVGQPIDKLVIIMAVENEEPLVFTQRTEDHITGLVRAIRYYNDQM
jgi:genome maintenance exonuclease 1